ncbi:hypothetical protein [Shimazuella kribbensis]|uniref:hypothetical protein n=1 Tax=Shimazuella kribbensis TaxID=139808 RepID=UPI00048D96D6|nr:hypothetical protein [Shimazuella kribbensis]
MTEVESSHGKKRGIIWIAASFLFCPCHLPFTLTLLLTILGGGTIGILVRNNIILAGILVTLIWAVGTWYGFRQLNRATCSIKPTKK